MININLSIKNININDNKRKNQKRKVDKTFESVFNEKKNKQNKDKYK